MDCVSELAELVGIAEGPKLNFDWSRIEETLQTRLPDDYKELAEIPQQGWFQGVARLIRPGDLGHPRDEYLGYYEYRLEDMRIWRENDSKRFPYPIFPEPGGLLPWATTCQQGLIFWLTAGSDPNRWPVVVAEAEFANFIEFDGTACHFLTSVVTSRLDLHQVGLNLGSGNPFFEELTVQQAPAVSAEQRWLDMQLYSAVPENEFPELADRLGQGPSKSGTVDWQATERRLGQRLPVDYKLFMDTYGPGLLGDIRIVGPNSVAREFDIFYLIDRTRRRMSVKSDAQSGMVLPIHPERGGLITWGESINGEVCAWAPSVANDPDAWGIVVYGADLGMYKYQWHRSFTAFLVAYIRTERRDPLGPREVKRPDPIVFTSDEEYL